MSSLKRPAAPTNTAITSDTILTSTLEIATFYVDSGVSVIPLRLDGSKAPALPAGGVNEFKKRMATREELADWFSTNKGIGLLGGPVSGGLEILDFDGDAERIFPAWHAMVEQIVLYLPIVETPSGGYHVLYRCCEVSGSHKIANDPNADKQTLIESRGYGGYVVGAGSPQEVHKLPMPYVQVAGPVLPEVPRISKADRLKLWKAARTFDKSDMRGQAIKKAARQFKPKPRPTGAMPPWEDFNRRGNWFDFLPAIGWKSNDGVVWTRPGKTSGTSVTLRDTANGDGCKVLHVFTSSTALEPGKSYSLSTVYCHYQHGGDFQASARALRQQGYGGLGC